MTEPLELPVFLRISAEVRKQAWAEWLAKTQKESTMTKIGAKEQAQRAMREGSATVAGNPAAANTATTEPKAKPEAPVAKEKPVRTKTSKKAARTPVKGKTAGKKPAKAAKTGDGPRPGSKLEIIGKMLARPEGCTAKQVLDACDWTAVSMNQQATALGVKLKKEKVDGVTVYRAA